MYSRTRSPNAATMTAAKAAKRSTDAVDVHGVRSWNHCGCV